MIRPDSSLSLLDRPANAAPEVATAACRSLVSARRSSTRKGAWIDRAFGAALAGGLLWAPFWLGGAWRLPWGVNALVFPGLALGYEAARLMRGREPPLAAREIAAPAAMFIVVIVWIVLQLTPLLPAPAIASLGQWTPTTISVNRGAGAIALTRLLTDAGVFWLAAQLGRDRALCLWLLHAVAAIVALYCAYGLFLCAIYDNAIPGFAARDGGSEVRATFVNRNSFAAFAGLGLVTVLALLTERRSAVGGSRVARALEAAGENAAPIAACLLIGAALMGSASRGGIFACAFGVLTLFGLVALRRRRRGEKIVGLAVGLVLLIVVFALRGDRLAARLAGTGLADAQRLPVYRIVGRAILDRPLAGFGYGGFADVFPLYRDATLPPIGVWEMAHEAYLEAALGLGLVFAALLTTALVWLAARCLDGALRRERDAAAPLAACAASALIGADALVDYSLEIEAVTLTFMTLIGLGVAQSRRSGDALC